MTAASAGPSSPSSAPCPAHGRATTDSGRTTADNEAIRELWRVHGAALLRFALKLTLGDRYRAEDIVQETLVRAWRHPEIVGTGGAAIRPWLFTVTRHIAIDLWRARARYEAAEETMDDRFADLPDPAEPIEQAVTALDVRAALAVLSAEHRQVIVEMYLRGRSVSDTAKVLGIPVGTVKSRSYYGIRQLRDTIVRSVSDPQQQLLA